MRWTPENIENEPFMSLRAGEREFEARRTNSQLHTFLGALALYNHAYVRNEGSGLYIFSFVDGFNEMAQYMADNDYPMYFNMTEVPKGDIDAYDRAIENSMRNFEIPEDWL